MEKNTNMAWVVTAVILTFIVMTQSAIASNMSFAPGDFGYVYWDYAINNILHGPIGFTIGVGLIGFGILEKISHNGFLEPMIIITGGVAMLKSDTLVSTISGTLF